MKTHYLALALVLALTGGVALAQGTKADYERAAGLRQQTTGKVLRANLRPNWIGETSRFWYESDLGEGKKQFFVVDANKGTKTPAFDHTKMAAALSRALGRAVTADKLPIDRLVFPDDKHLRVTVRDKSFELDFLNYEPHPIQDASGQATAIAPAQLPRGSGDARGDSQLTFVNRTNQTVTLNWVDGDGKRTAYGTLKPGEERVQHTYAGHLWVAVGANGRTVAGFLAGDVPQVAVIEAVRGQGRPQRGPQGTSPDGKWQVAVRGYNAYLKELATGTETQLTTDGTKDNAYEPRLWWSPDSTKVMVVKAEPEQEHKIYLVESSPKDQVQPKLKPLDYLKPGDRLEKPRLCLIDVASKKTTLINDELYFNPFNLMEEGWTPDSKEFRFLYNQRGHQLIRLIGVDAATGTARTILDERQKTFISWTSRVFYQPVAGTGEVIWMSERSGWNHLYLIDSATGKVKNPITTGEWVVRGVEKVDEAKRQVWFRACGNLPGQDPYHIHYGRINFDGTGLTWLTEGDGTHKITYSPSGEFYVDTYSRVDLPPVSELRRTSDGKKVMDIERADAKPLVATGWKLPERFVAKGRDGKTDIYGIILRPTNFDPKKKYPVIENIYAGPHDSHVPKDWRTLYGGQELAELGFIVVQIDGMGTANRSKAFHDVCWKNIADAGFPDRILWMKAAAEKYPYLDLMRVGIYGTSAGGQNALTAMLTHGEFYKAAVSDCGCHDNRMDKIWWNEQWMGWPIEKHYDEQSNVTLAKNLTGKLFLMVGELDTNVDPSSTFQVVNQLIANGKDFDYLVAPGVGHGVLGLPYARRRMQDFFVRSLHGVEPRAK